MLDCLIVSALVTETVKGTSCRDCSLLLAVTVISSISACAVPAVKNADSASETYRYFCLKRFITYPYIVKIKNKRAVC
jgi:hypothetical protein